MTLVCDAGVVYAALDRRDRSHPACRALMEEADLIVVPAPVLVEVDQLAESRDVPGATEAIIESVLEEGVVIADLELEDYLRVHELIGRYRDLPLGFVDAAVISVAERLEETTIATLDRKHFSVVKPLHCERFTLLP